MRSILKEFLGTDLFKYGLVSLFALILDVTTLTLCKEVFNLNSIVSATAGFTLGMIFVYLVSVKYIFGRSSYSRAFEISVFMLIGVVGLLINDSIIALLTLITNVYVAKFSAIFIVFTWNFLARKKLMTKKEIIDEQA